MSLPLRRDEPSEAADDAGTQREEFGRVVIEVANREPIERPISRRTTLIGSAKFCNIQLVSSEVSPAHCVLTVDEDGLRVRDLRSKSNTRVNDRTVDVSLLRDGDCLQLGPFTFRIQWNSPAPAETPPIESSERPHDSAARDRTAPRRPPAVPSPTELPTEPESASSLLEGPILAESLVLQGILTRSRAESLVNSTTPEFSIDEYRLRKVIGAGGMGWLYLAEDTPTQQHVAVKVFSEKRDVDPGLLTRFLLEARAGQRLKHPNIVRAFKIGKTHGLFGDVHYFVMEYVPGANLQELVSTSGPVDWEHACDLISQAAAGLDYAHQLGMVHRDVKPENLLVDRFGHLKLLDFGLALVDEEDEFSLSMIFGQDCLGTADYIAPEQTRESHEVDGRADVYSLGCTFYAILTGKLPFPESTASKKLEAHRTRLAKPLQTVRPGIPAELAAVVERMMAKKPAERFQSMGDVCEALSRFAQHGTIPIDFEAVLRGRVKLARKRIDAAELTRGSSHTVIVSPSRAKLAESLVGEQLSSVSSYNGRPSPQGPPGGSPADPEIAALTAAWPQLPETVKQQIREIVGAGKTP